MHSRRRRWAVKTELVECREEFLLQRTIEREREGSLFCKFLPFSQQLSLPSVFIVGTVVETLTLFPWLLSLAVFM